MASLPNQQHNPNLSEEDDPGNEPESSRLAGIRRGTRACDRCRKIKSKCEPGTDDKCKSCEIANAPCTFQGPSFKRGPPKGYIHSIEQRWHQVECILATIMESPRAQDIIGDLRTDSFANSILERVLAGPYGSRGRLHQQQDPSSEHFYSSLMEVPEHAPMRDDRRSRRQSRVSREIVSQDPNASATPTREWQDQLARRLGYSIPGQWTYATSSVTPTSRSSSASATTDYSRTKRRLDWPVNAPLQQNNWNNLYTFPDVPQITTDPSNVDETTEAFGNLSVDQSKEFRYHGAASGLPLLAQSHRKAGDDKQENRIWSFTSSVESSYDMTSEEQDVEVHMPPPDVQNDLLHLYFTYVHPFFPVIHKQDFLHNYQMLGEPHNTSFPGQSSTSTSRHPMQRPCKMLLLSMFAIAARYSNRFQDPDVEDNNNTVNDAGKQYAEDAHRLLQRKYQSSRPTTCQALLLLAIREFGMGAMDRGWLYSGMAMRMAVDLGMNRNADSWTTDGEQPIFTEIEKQIRKHIWWSCCTSDKLSAVWLGRPITFRANDYSTSFLDVDEVDETEMWQPYPPGILGDFNPQPSKLISSFREACRLSVIITDIMDKIYPVQVASETPRLVLFEQLETRLTKWLTQLPEDLLYPPSNRHTPVLPHVLMLHIEYQAAVLLLHRAFLPSDNEKPSDPQGHLLGDPLALKAFDICIGAAVQISSMVEIYNDKFGLERVPPFLCIYLQSAGIMHVITLARRPSDPQATLGLTRCIEACKQLETLWPTAARLRTLLEGAKVQLDESTYSLESGVRKRNLEDAFGGSKDPDADIRDAYGMPVVNGYRGGGIASTSASIGMAWNDAHNARMVAHSLGGGGASAEGANPFYPGYQWWPSQLITTEALTHMTMTASTNVPSVSAPVLYSSLPGYAQGQHISQSHPSAQSHGHQEPLTFGQESNDFVQGVSYPSFDYDHYWQSSEQSKQDPSAHQ